MSRYRPPQEKSSPYITAAEGDRSENAEYIYRKKELGEIDRRIRYLQKRLPDLKVVPEQQQTNKQTFFGAWVTVECTTDETVTNSVATYRIVGSDEFDPNKGYISLDSPLAKGLLKKTIDDEIIIHADKAELVYVVIDVNYIQPSEKYDIS